MFKLEQNCFAFEFSKNSFLSQNKLIDKNDFFGPETWKEKQTKKTTTI